MRFRAEYLFFSPEIHNFATCLTTKTRNDEKDIHIVVGGAAGQRRNAGPGDRLPAPVTREIIIKRGQSLFPESDRAPESGKRSLNGNIQIVINSLCDVNQRTRGLAHEFGHVLLYLLGLPYGESGNEQFLDMRESRFKFEFD